MQRRLVAWMLRLGPFHVFHHDCGQVERDCWKIFLTFGPSPTFLWFMSKTILTLIVLAVIAIGIGGCSGIYGVSTYNTAKRLHNMYDAKLVDNTSEFDNMWKKISQTAQIPEAKKDA